MSRRPFKHALYQHSQSSCQLQLQLQLAVSNLARGPTRLGRGHRRPFRRLLHLYSAPKELRNGNSAPKEVRSVITAVCCAKPSAMPAAWGFGVKHRATAASRLLAILLVLESTAWHEGGLPMRSNRAGSGVGQLPVLRALAPPPPACSCLPACTAVTQVLAAAFGGQWHALHEVLHGYSLLHEPLCSTLCTTLHLARCPSWLPSLHLTSPLRRPPWAQHPRAAPAPRPP